MMLLTLLYRKEIEKNSDFLITISFRPNDVYLRYQSINQFINSIRPKHQV